MPGGRIHRPRARRDADSAAASATTERRPPASAARVRRLTPGRRHAARLAVLALGLAVLVPMPSRAGTAEPRSAAVARHPALAATSLDARVGLLTAELRLTPEQALKVRALLQQQREDVRRLWSDTTVAPALRVGRTQGISDRTAEAIRAVLDDTQRRQYIQPRQRETAVGAAGADPQAWLATEAGK